jgi:hypothetical protein
MAMNRTGIVEAWGNPSNYGATWVTSAKVFDFGYDGIDEIVPVMLEWQQRTKGTVVYDRSHALIAEAISDTDSRLKISASAEIPGSPKELQAIHRMNADFRTSRILVHAENCQPLAEEYLGLGWRQGSDGKRDINNMEPDPSRPQDCARAAMNAWLETSPRKWRPRDYMDVDPGQKIFERMRAKRQHRSMRL